METEAQDKKPRAPRKSVNAPPRDDESKRAVEATPSAMPAQLSLEPERSDPAVCRAEPGGADTTSKEPMSNDELKQLIESSLAPVAQSIEAVRVQMEALNTRMTHLRREVNAGLAVASNGAVIAQVSAERAEIAASLRKKPVSWTRLAVASAVVVGVFCVFYYAARVFL